MKNEPKNLIQAAQDSGILQIVKVGEPIPPVCTDRNEAIKRIRAALKKRTGRDWSVRGNRGTAWGWIAIEAPPRRRRYDFETGLIKLEESYGYMSAEDRQTLGEIFQGGKPCHPQGLSIPASGAHRTEYVDLAEGREPRAHGVQYWD